MTTLTRGQTSALTALFYTAPDAPVDVTGLSLTVSSLADASIVLGPVASPFVHPATGVYQYAWSIPDSLPIGQYLVLWSATVSGSPINANETVTVEAEATFTAGACQPWPVKWPANCDLSAATPEVTGIAAQAASDMLYELSAQRFGLCTTTLRPCREECFGNGFGWGFRSIWWWGDYAGGGPTPYWYNGQWYNLGCGQCGSGCSCTALSEVFLPGPVAQIVEVKVDGVVLVNGVDYRVDDYRKLVRLNGETWPYCNDLNQADTAAGTWSVTASFGEPVPMLAQLAMGELSCNFLSFLLGEECDLPPGVTDISRQGISMSIAQQTTDLLTLFQRYPMTYLFLKTYNPHGLQARSQAYDLDGPDFRIVGTA